MILIICHIFFYDIWFYISHIMLHNPKIYFIHKIHHAKKYDELIYLDANEGHIVEHIVQPIGIFAPYFVFEFSPIMFVIAFIIILIRGQIRHDNRFSWLIGNHHILHHKHRRYNYGEYWIDYLCGTMYPNKSEYIYGVIYT